MDNKKELLLLQYETACPQFSHCFTRSCMHQSISIQRNSIRAWVLAARPKTLSGAAMPVCVALTLAYTTQSRLHLLPALLCLLFALAMQVLANFVNDYFDFRDGTDNEERLGPLRACAQGWVSPNAMRMAMALTTFVAVIIGMPLVIYGGWPMVGVGAVCLLLCFFYTLGGARHALGDVLVLLGFGIIPVCITYYLQLGNISLLCLLLSVSCGLVVDTLLVVNNYRDYPTDSACGKCTLVVMIGRRKSELLYLALGIIGWFLLSVGCLLSGLLFTIMFPLIYVWLHVRTYQNMCRIGSGRSLNHILGVNSRNMLIYGLTVIAGLLTDNVIT